MPLPPLGQKNQLKIKLIIKSSKPINKNTESMQFETLAKQCVIDPTEALL